MNERRREVLKAGLSDEKDVLKAIREAFERAARDCADRIAELNARKDAQGLMAAVYQKQWQQAVKGQIDAIIEALGKEEFKSVSEYLEKCYENGYVGAMYDLAGQGIPVIAPIDQRKVVKAVETDSKLSGGAVRPHRRGHGRAEEVRQGGGFARHGAGRELGRHG